MESPDRSSRTEQFFTALLGSPFFALYGIFVFFRALFAPVRFIERTVGALSATIACPHGHPNETVGRWSCAACGTAYHGWVGRCGFCGAPAGHIDCATCGVGIHLPWGDR